MPGSKYSYTRSTLPAPDLLLKKRRRLPELRTLHGEHFSIRVEHWWKPSERRAARLSLRVLDTERERIDADVRKKMNRLFFFGES